MKKPVLALGIILFGLFLYQVKSGNKEGLFYNSKLHPSSCRASLIKIEKRIPANWRAFCEGNNLAVEVKEVMVPEEAPALKNLLYRQVVNHMTFLARVSEPDILEKVDIVRFKLIHPKMEINAVTEGKFLVKLVTLNSPEHIMAHLKSTVQVKETVK